MRLKFAIVKNVVHAKAALEALSARDLGVPGMGLFYGKTGFGKTSTVTWLVNQTNGIFVRASATWTPSSMLGQIMVELGAAPTARLNVMLDHIVTQMAMTQRPLFVDEADYLVKSERMIETLRDIHDLTGVPVIMIGMAGIERRLFHRAQLTRRISRWVEFMPTDLEDARIVTDTLCEVRITDDLLERIHEETGGSIGLIVVALAQIETAAKTNGWSEVNSITWGRRPFFLDNKPRAVR